MMPELVRRIEYRGPGSEKWVVWATFTEAEWQRSCFRRLTKEAFNKFLPGEIIRLVTYRLVKVSHQRIPRKRAINAYLRKERGDYAASDTGTVKAVTNARVRGQGHGQQKRLK